MEKPIKKTIAPISRRGFLPIIAGTLLLPLFGFGKTKPLNVEDNEVYETLITSDGKAVRVKKSVVIGATIIKKNNSNRSLLEWLKNK